MRLGWRTKLCADTALLLEEATLSMILAGSVISVVAGMRKYKLPVIAPVDP
jgi:hypothetical protein